MITVGLIDDHDLFRSSLCALLSAQRGFSVSEVAESGQFFFNRMVLLDAVPDIAITDYLMPALAKSLF